LLFVCLLPWQPLGQYGASSRPMLVSSGFRSSPGHAALGNAICIAPAHCRGHQNGRQTRCFLIIIVDFVINNNRSQRPCYGPLKLKLRHSDIYYNVISLLLFLGIRQQQWMPFQPPLLPADEPTSTKHRGRYNYIDFYINLLNLTIPFDSGLKK
jgi:hypothetical protein